VEVVNFMSRPLDGFGKHFNFLPLPGLEPGTVQPVANSYTERAIRVPLTAKYKLTIPACYLEIFLTAETVMIAHAQ
jgi:hypothetical protein